MANNRIELRQEVKRLKQSLKKAVEEFVVSKDTSGLFGEYLIATIARIVELQKKLNATYKPMDERVIIERASKRVAKSAAAKGTK